MSLTKISRKKVTPMQSKIINNNIEKTNKSNSNNIIEKTTDKGIEKDIEKGVGNLQPHVSTKITKNDTKKIDLRTPKGTTDFHSTDCQILNEILKTCDKTFALFSNPLDTPTFELTDILLSKYDTSENESVNVYKLEDQGGDDCTLRFDLTVPFARFLAQNNLLKYNRYQIGKVFRRDQPSLSRGRYREFYQCDFDIAGNYSLMTSEAQILKMIDEVLSKFNIGEFRIKINDRRILNKVLEKCEVPENNYFAILSSIDKINKITNNEMINELKSKGMEQKQIDFLINFISNAGEIKSVLHFLGECELDFSILIDEYLILDEYLKAYGIDERTILFDLSLARGAAYYTGLILEAEFIDNDVGSVAGGGRYDNLVNMFKPSLNIPCIGFSIGIYRIFSILKNQTKKSNNRGEQNYLVSSAISPLIKERMGILSILWEKGIKASSNFIKRVNLSEQIKFARNNNFSGVIVLLPDEYKKGSVKVIKNINTEKEEEVLISSLVDFILH